MLGLKSFHVFFICVSILLCVLVGIWGTQEFARSGSGMGLSMAVVFGLTGAALVVYAVRTFGKLRKLDPES